MRRYGRPRSRPWKAMTMSRNENSAADYAGDFIGSIGLPNSPIQTVARWFTRHAILDASEIRAHACRAFVLLMYKNPAEKKAIESVLRTDAHSTEHVTRWLGEQVLRFKKNSIP